MVCDQKKLGFCCMWAVMVTKNVFNAAAGSMLKNGIWQVFIICAKVQANGLFRNAPVVIG